MLAEPAQVPRRAGASSSDAIEPAVALQAAPAPLSRRTLQEAIDDYVGVLRQGGLKEKQVLDAEGDLRVLIEAYAPDKPIAEIGPAEAGQIWSALQSLPPHHRTNTDLQALDLIARGKKARELKLTPLHPRTVKSYLGSLVKLFERELQAGHVSENLFRGKTAMKNGQRASQ
jgi:hypothetical protein